MIKTIWTLYLLWVITALANANVVAQNAATRTVDLVNLPWDQVMAAASLALAGGAVSFTVRLGKGSVDAGRVWKELFSDLTAGAFAGSLAFAAAADMDLSVWRTFLVVAVSGAAGGVMFDRWVRGLFSRFWRTP